MKMWNAANPSSSMRRKASSMSTKVQQPQTVNPVSSRAMRLVGRFYRWVAWAGVLATIFFTALMFIDQWRSMSMYYTSMWEVARNATLAGGLIFVTGLFMSGMAFLVSLLIEAGVKMLENSHEQTDLLRQMVLHQSDVTSKTRLREKASAREADLSPYEVPQQMQQRK
jgi:hypothetical protein